MLDCCRAARGLRARCDRALDPKPEQPDRDGSLAEDAAYLHVFRI